MSPRARGEPQPVECSARADDLGDGRRSDLGFGCTRDGGLHGGVYRSGTDFAGGTQQVELRRALDQAQLRGESVGFDEAVPGEAGASSRPHRQASASPPSSATSVPEGTFLPRWLRALRPGPRVADTISSGLWILQLRSCPLAGSPVRPRGEPGRCGRARASAWLVGDEGLVSVEAREVVHVGVVILGGTPAGPGHKGGEATLPGELAGGRLASSVFGALDPTVLPMCSSCCVVLADDAALPA